MQEREKANMEAGTSCISAGSAKTHETWAAKASATTTAALQEMCSYRGITNIQTECPG